MPKLLEKETKVGKGSTLECHACSLSTEEENISVLWLSFAVGSKRDWK